ncbi:Glutamyl-tRNA reductase-binding protein chloroplastic, partial [Zea mays]
CDSETRGSGGGSRGVSGRSVTSVRGAGATVGGGGSADCRGACRVRDSLHGGPRRLASRRRRALRRGFCRCTRALPVCRSGRRARCAGQLPRRGGYNPVLRQCQARERFSFPFHLLIWRSVLC